MRRLMTKIIVLVVALMFSSLAQGGFPASLNDEQPAVTKAVAPIYPPVAAAANATGKVIVDVKINGAGEVISSKARGGFPLFKMAAEHAASRWRFATEMGSTKERSAQLDFTFTIVDDDKDAGASFSLPYHIEIATARPVVKNIQSY